jgi:hypothetical protein
LGSFGSPFGSWQQFLATQISFLFFSSSQFSDFPTRNNMDTSTNLVSQIKDDYLAYSMAVIIGRAIPSLTDGMKPVQRRIMTAMRWLNLRPDNRYMKSARV